MPATKLYSALKLGINDNPIPLMKMRADDLAPEVGEEVGLAYAADRQFPTICAHAQRIGATARKGGATAIEPVVTHEITETTGVASHRLDVTMGEASLGFLRFTVPMGTFLEGRDTNEEGDELQTVCTDARAMLESALLIAHGSDEPLAITAGLRSATE